MELLLDTFKNFFGMIEGKFVVATIGMILIILLAVYLLFTVVISFKKRKEAVEIKLPDINDNGEVIEEVSKFPTNKEIVVELIDTSEDDSIKSDVTTDEKPFLTALTLETGNFVLDTKTETTKLNMPDVGEIDYEKIKEDKRKEKEQESIDRLRRKLAKENEYKDEFDAVENIGFGFMKQQES